MSEKIKQAPRTLSQRINADPFARIFSMVLAGLAWVGVFIAIAYRFGGEIALLTGILLFLLVAGASFINTVFGWRYN